MSRQTWNEILERCRVASPTAEWREQTLYAARSLAAENHPTTSSWSGFPVEGRLAVAVALCAVLVLWTANLPQEPAEPAPLLQSADLAALDTALETHGLVARLAAVHWEAAHTGARQGTRRTLEENILQWTQ